MLLSVPFHRDKPWLSLLQSPVSKSEHGSSTALDIIISMKQGLPLATSFIACDTLLVILMYLPSRLGPMSPVNNYTAVLRMFGASHARTISCLGRETFPLLLAYFQSFAMIDHILCSFSSLTLSTVEAIMRTFDWGVF
jgi:hypothetical protein